MRGDRKSQRRHGRVPSAARGRPWLAGGAGRGGAEPPLGPAPGPARRGCPAPIAAAAPWRRQPTAPGRTRLRPAASRQQPPLRLFVLGKSRPDLRGPRAPRAAGSCRELQVSLCLPAACQALERAVPLSGSLQEVVCPWGEGRKVRARLCSDAVPGCHGTAVGFSAHLSDKCCCIFPPDPLSSGK